MVDYEFAVRCHPHVQFNTVARGGTALARREPEGRERVLRGMAGGAAMPDDKGVPGCGKSWGSHVDPVWVAWKLPHVNGHINNVGKGMWALCTTR